MTFEGEDAIRRYFPLAKLSQLRVQDIAHAEKPDGFFRSCKRIFKEQSHQSYIKLFNIL